MASTTTYESLLRRATEPKELDLELAYNITDKVQTDGQEGADAIVKAAAVHWAFPDLEVKERILGLFDKLVVECGVTVHQALEAQGFLALLRAIQEEPLKTMVAGHLKQWQSEFQPGAPATADPTPTSSQPTGAVIKRQKSGEPVSQRPRQPAGKFSYKPIKPLAKFLTLTYLQAHAQVNRARRAPNHALQSLHIAKQALHLVIRLNDSVPDEGPEDDHFDEGIELEDQLTDFEEKFDEWTAEPDLKWIEVIREQYSVFYQDRFYFHEPRDPDSDSVFLRLVAYDKREINYKLDLQKAGVEGVDVVTTEQSDDEEGGAQLVSLSGRASPVADAAAAAAAPAASDQATDAPAAEELTKVDVRLDEESKEGQVEAGASEVDDTAIALAVEEDLAKADKEAAEGSQEQESVERLRQFHDKQADDPPEQTFNCPVPGCDRSFDKHYLLKHHIRDHDDRPYTCPVDNCTRAFSSPIEQRRHEALHRIEKLGVLSGSFQPSTFSWPQTGRSNVGASTSTAGGAVPPTVSAIPSVAPAVPLTTAPGPVPEPPKPADPKPVDPKPESKPEDIKPEETKPDSTPAADDKTAPASVPTATPAPAATEAKPEETKPEEAKPEETKPDEEKK